MAVKFLRKNIQRNSVKKRKDVVLVASKVTCVQICSLRDFRS